MFTLQNQVLLQLSQICNVAASAISPAAAGFRSTTSRSSRAFIPQAQQQTIGNSNTLTVVGEEKKNQNGSTPSSVEKVSSLAVSGGGKNEITESLQVTKLFLKSNGLKELSKTEESFISMLASKIFQNSLKSKSSASSITNCEESTTTTTIASTATANALDRCLDILKQLNIPELQLQATHVVQKNFATSYKSSGSFDMDKCMGSILSSPLTRSNNLFVFNRTSNYAVPYRTFKTDRDIQAEAERNPSILNRLKLKLFPARIDLNQNQAAGGAAAVNSPEKSEKLKNILSDSPPAEASRLKIAFAEGYVAANPTPEGKSRTYRWLRTLQQVLAIAVFTAILASLMGSFGGSIFRINNVNGNEVQPEDITVTFHDVKGVDEAKAELQEVVEFLRNPEKFVQLGGKLPKGVLLVGPPGTGKTLLARAVAGEAGVPYFHAAGPEFDEILVGQGARRVRDLFKAAKAKAPCVIFIDEIDSVGAKRTNSVLHPYANQTINQLLSEMDGFRQNEGVIVLGATNRREDLDKALLRPGRFDVEVTVAPPEYQGRKEILEHYLSKVKKGTDIDIDILARGTTGFTGADIENVVNQAALRAAIEGAESVGKKHLDFARDKVIMGPERKTRIPDEETNRITAYHEGGHALVAHYTKDSNPLHKVTIIPRGPSLGHTAYIPAKEQYHVTRSQLMAMMDTMMGGRAAEELIFGTEKITSGASSDLKQASSIASHMVKEWGMSDKVGLRTVDDSRSSFVTVNELGPQTSELIDREINRLLQESYERAKNILKVHSKEHKALAEALMKYETLDAEDVKAIFAGNATKHAHPKILTQALKEKNEKQTGQPVGSAPPPLPEALTPTKKLIN